MCSFDISVNWCCDLDITCTHFVRYLFSDRFTDFMPFAVNMMYTSLELYSSQSLSTGAGSCVYRLFDETILVDDDTVFLVHGLEGVARMKR